MNSVYRESDSASANSFSDLAAWRTRLSKCSDCIASKRWSGARFGLIVDASSTGSFIPRRCTGALPLCTQFSRPSLSW